MPEAVAADFHVLVVDDEPNVRDVLHELISVDGYQVSSAGGGQEALALMQRTPIDLVITDLMMPEMNGWQLLKFSKQRFPKTLVVVLTGYISGEGEAMLTNSQVDGYIPKPVEYDRLKNILQSLLISGEMARTPRAVAIDDDPASLQAIDHTLQRDGIEVTTFQDPGDGVQFIQHNPTDLIILDLIIPNSSGFQICQSLRSFPEIATVPILILTAAASRENVQKAIQLNVNGFLTKPFEPRNLRQKVQQLLRQSRS